MAQFREIVTKLLESRSFFALSGIVDANYAPSYSFKNGEPVTVEAYHMTPHTFTKFKIGQVNAWGEGVYLTNNPEDCSFNPETIKNWNKMRLFATFFKPFIYEDKIGDEFRNWLWSEIQKIINEETLNKSEILKHKYSFEKSCMDVYYRLLFKNAMGTAFKNQSSLNVMNTIKHYDDLYKLNIYNKLDLDGMILPFGKTGMADQSNKDTVWYVCYKPNQIKSYEGNNGNYDLNSDDINESQELTERILPEIPDDKYAELLKDTSSNGKANAYTKFFGNYLIKNRLHKDEDIAGLTKRHNALYQAGLVKPISDYVNIFELIHDLDDKSDYKTNSEKDKESRIKAKVIGNVNGFNLYQITSYDASKKYGAGTKWCTTASTTRHYFDNYKTKSSDIGWRKLIYAINENDNKYALVVTRSVDKTWFRSTIEVYNASDKIVGSYSLQGIGSFDYKTDKLSIKYDDVFNYYSVYDDKELVDQFMQWSINKYKLTKDYMEKEFYKQYPFMFTANESVDGKFYEYSNTDKNAIGFSGVNTYAEKGDSYTMIINMSPQEFLSLSTANFIKDDIPWFEEQIKNGVPLAMPYLEIEIENPKKKIARVYGHEGRHRSLAVSNLGYTQAQCILWIRDFTRAGYKKEDLIGWTIMGQKPRIGNKNTHENNSFVIK